jgi:hypothetical protein
MRDKNRSSENRTSEKLRPAKMIVESLKWGRPFAALVVHQGNKRKSMLTERKTFKRERNCTRSIEQDF